GVHRLLRAVHRFGGGRRRSNGAGRLGCVRRGGRREPRPGAAHHEPLRAPRGSGHRGRRPRRGTAGLAAGWGVGWVLSSPMPTEPVQVLLISGPGGVGKSTLGWEVATQLRRLGIAHVLLDSDELDRAWPLTTAER